MDNGLAALALKSGVRLDPYSHWPASWHPIVMRVLGESARLRIRRLYIKVKLGGLRIQGGGKRLVPHVEAAENEADRTCAVCGCACDRPNAPAYPLCGRCKERTRERHISWVEPVVDGESGEYLAHPPERALSAGERRALVAVGLAADASTARNAGAARKFARAAFLNLFHSALSIQEAAEILGVTPGTVRTRVKARTLLGLSLGPEVRIPAQQFHGGGELPHWRTVMRAMPANLTALEALSWLETPNIDLADDSETPRSPRAYLLAGGDVRYIASLFAQLGLI